MGSPLPWMVGGILEPRIANKIRRLLPSGCWEWGAALTNGYGVIWIDGRLQRAHRVVYKRFKGPIPDGHELDHVRARGCVTRACVNPDHTEPVTQVENNARSDSASALNARKTHCKRGHELTSENTYIAKRERVKRERFCRTCCRERDRQRYQRRTEAKA